MKTNITLDELITSSVIDLTRSFLSFEDKNFNAQVRFLDLDKKTDFKHADLAGVDFSHSDIRGFDFTGADLRGATGVDVQWDTTTSLKGANTDDSLFAYRIERDRLLAENPALAKQVARLSKEYWPNAILGVEKLLRDKNQPHRRRIAQAVFDETPDLVVRSNVLLFLRLATESGEEHRHFIYNIFASHGDETNVVRAAIRALAALYPDHKGTLNILMAYLDHQDATIRNEAFNGVLNSVHLKSVLDNVLPRVTAQDNGLHRRTLLGRIAQMAGPAYMAAALDSDVANFLDYTEIISARKTHSMAQNALLKEKYARIARSRHGKLEEGLNVKESEINKRAAEFQRLLKNLREQYRVPLRFEWEKMKNR